MTYLDFLKTKVEIAPVSGFDVSPDELSDNLKPHQKDAIVWALKGGRRALFESFGLGKCHGKGTKILMYDCSVKNVEDVQVGDQLMGDDGMPRNVLSLAHGTDMLYRVTLKNGDSFTCNSAHILSTEVSNKHGGHKTGEVVNIPITEWMKLPDYAKRNCYKAYKRPLVFQYQQIEFDPYVYGVWLGDGTKGHLDFTINDIDTEIVDYLNEWSYAKGFTCRIEEGRGCKIYHYSKGAVNSQKYYEKDFVTGSYYEEKRIYPEYLRNAKHVRLQVLAGLLDTDGYLVDNCYEIATKFAGLRDDILFLCRSLGLSVRHCIKRVNDTDYYRIYISGNTEIIPCKTRKKASARRQIKNPLRYGMDVEEIGIGEYYGFTIDRNHLYMLADFTVTHNTAQELEFCRQVLKHDGGKALIVLPLGVRQEFKRDAVNILGMEEPTYITHLDEATEDGVIYMTNYERVRDGDIDPTHFSCCVLDEAAVLRSFGSKTYQTFLPKFKGVKYKLVATATPAPNRLKELIHYAGFLEVLDTGQALTRFFQRDSTKANNLTLYPHKVEEFWLWVSSWALFIERPSDLGYDDEGYALPELEIRTHCISNPEAEHVGKDGQFKLMNDATASLSEASREKKESIKARVAKAKEIVDSDPEASFILWHDRDAEKDELKRQIPGIVEIYGTMDYEEREKRVLDFSDGKFRLFATKKSLSGVGCNFQYHCHREIFVGIDYAFHDFVQALHRTYRFLQDQKVIVDIIYTEAEDPIYRVLMDKWKLHDEQQQRMKEIVKKYGLTESAQAAKMQRSIGVEKMVVEGKNFTAIHGDCVEETAKMETDSVDMVLTSIPFCYDEETEVLTRFGWMKFADLTGNEQIATYNDKKKSLEYQLPTSVVDEPYKGEMISFKGRAFDLCVTPNHRMYAAKRTSGEPKYQIYTADEIAKAYENAERKTENGERILRGFNLKLIPEYANMRGNWPERIEIPKLPEHVKNAHGVELYWIKTDDFMRLAGWYLSEGHADDFEKRTGGRISIGQSPEKNPENYQEIMNLFERIGLPPSEGKNQITVWCRNLAFFLQTEFGHKAEHKRIPRWVFQLDTGLLQILRHTMMKGDGSKDGTCYASISRQLRDDFQELCVLTGWRAIIPDKDKKWVYTGTQQLYPEIRHTPKRFEYDGRIGCVTVPNGLIIVRRNGFVCISGNSNHYEYTPSYNDFGHNENTEKFFEQMDFLSPELLRVLRPGRVFACHVKDRVLFGNATGTGMPTMEPFHAMCIEHYMKHGFQYFGMITIVTDVVRENNQTYRLGWTEQCKDGTKMGVGCPEYVLLFRKLPTDTSTAYADVPVEKTKEEYTRAQWQIDAHGFWRDGGDRLLTKEEVMAMPVDRLQAVYRKYSRDHVYDYDEHVEMCKKLDSEGHLPATFMVMAPGSWAPDVWDDINRMLTLNTTQSQRRQALHVCPLQFETVDRLINRYSNEGDLIFDPFGGVGTVPLRAMKLGRRGLMTELNEGYFLDAVGYLHEEEENQDVPTLFDFLETEEGDRADG